jgi:hypothetical protein
MSGEIKTFERNILEITQRDSGNIPSNPEEYRPL